MVDLAALDPRTLSILRDLGDGVEPIDGGFCIKHVDGGGFCIDVPRMFYNWRLVLSPRPPIAPGPHMLIEHGWCYFGHGVDAAGHPRTMHSAFLAAVAAARVWDGHGAPPGYDKQAF